MTENENSTALEPILQKGRLALKEGASLAEIQKAMALPQDDVKGAVPKVPPMPAPVVLDDETKKALRRLGDVFAVVQPEQRRALTSEEQAQVFDEQQVLKKITALLSTREEALKEIVRHHMDVVAEEDGGVDDDTERDANGHYVLAAPQNPERFDIPGTNQAWSREYRAGSLGLDASVLERMLTDEEITRDAYLAMTREVRVFDQNKAMVAANNPKVRDQVLTAISKMTTRGRPGTSLFTRKKK